MLKDLDKELKRLIRKHKVPGASVAVLRGKRIVARFAAGVVNKNTRVKTTTDTLFQIGSITKPMTATMILQLRDEGKLKLEDPILTYLPDFRIADMHRLKNVTIRHLLSHTSGIDGDFFPRTDSGDRAIEQLLDMSAMLPSLFKPGTNYSYSNIGFAVLGRVIEVLEGRSFDKALKKRIFEPLEMTRTITSVKDIKSMDNVAMPHNNIKGTNINIGYLNWDNIGPAGSIISSAKDMSQWLKLHLNNGYLNEKSIALVYIYQLISRF